MSQGPSKLDIARHRVKLENGLMLRSIQGAWGHAVAAVLVTIATTVPSAEPALFRLLAALLVLFVSVRMVAFYCRSRRLGNRQLLYRLVVFSVYGCGLVWGLFGAVAVARFGIDNRNATLPLLYIAGIAGAGVHVFLRSAKMAILFVLAVLGPGAVVTLFMGRPAIGIAASILFYTCFLAGQAVRLSAEYWERLIATDALEQAAIRDPLTGLLNRRACSELLRTAVEFAVAHGSRLALLFIDLDGFKQINDGISHSAGDLLLREIATRLDQTTGTRGTVARLGGDEFVILIEEPGTVAGIDHFSRQLMAALRYPAKIEGHPIQPGASLGIAVFPTDATGAEDLIKASDQAMYAAKALGGNRFCFAAEVKQKLVA